MIDVSVLRAMAAAGAPMEAIFVFIEAQQALEESKLALQRSKETERKRRQRAALKETQPVPDVHVNPQCPALSRDVPGTNRDTSSPPQVSFPLYNPLPSFPPSPPKKPPVPRETGPYSQEFEGFWKGYPRTPVMSKKEAFACWKRLSSEDREKACSAVPKFREFLRAKPDHPAVHACRFLSQRRFDGFAEGLDETLPVGCWIAIDTPEWTAWTQYRGRPFPPDKKGGWTVPTQWPPNGKAA